MSAARLALRGRGGRRRVHNLVLGLVALAATASTVLGGTLLAGAQAPFERAFAQQHGAHLNATFAAQTATEAELADTAETAGVTAAAGPFPTTATSLVVDVGLRLPDMTIVGRDEPGGAVDDVTLTGGRWATEPGEIVLRDDGRSAGPDSPTAVGVTLTAADLPGAPTLKIVGLARSVSETADAWVVTEQVAALTPKGGAADWQMLYRFDEAATKSQVAAGRSAVVAGLDPDALAGSRSWLATRERAAAEAQLLVPFLVAFGVLGVAMAVLIVGNVVTGSVATAIHRIGVLKALGFTPAQVVRSVMARALLPAAVGTALGAVAGNLAAMPVLAQTNRLYGTGDAAVGWWVNGAAVAGMLLVVAVTAWSAALRAGRLRTVDALAVGRTDRANQGIWSRRLAALRGRSRTGDVLAASRSGGNRGARVSRLTALLPVPPSIGLGLSRPFARPGRAAAVLAAVGFGAAAVTFAVGVSASLSQIQETQTHGDVAVYRSGPPVDGKPPPLDFDAVAAIAATEPDVSGYSGLAQSTVTVAGITGSVEAHGLTGTATAEGYRMVDGEWFDGVDEIVVSTPFLTATESKLGDTITLAAKGERLRVRIVGEVFNTEDRGMQILTDLDTLTAADPTLRPGEFTVVAKPGADPEALAAALNPKLADLDAEAVVHDGDAESYVLVINALTALITLMLVAVAAMGVLNVVLLETRERVRDIGIHKALGMVPRQAVAMVLASVLVTGLAGGLVGVPVGMWLQRTVVARMASGAGYALPESLLDVYRPEALALLVTGGIVIAILGALPPAGWAARTRTATALRAE